jgi:hypothetical protein
MNLQAVTGVKPIFPHAVAGQEIRPPQTTRYKSRPAHRPLVKTAFGNKEYDEKCVK